MIENKLIGLLGGTFDPIHLGHLDIAAKLAKKLNLAQVQFIPSGNPPHRQPIASTQDRLAMVKLALANHKNFVVNDIEIKKPELRYTIDTLKVLKHELKDKTLCFILATDAFAHFNQWRDWQQILNYCHLIIAPRPDFPFPTERWVTHLLDRHEIKTAQQLHDKNSGCILIEDISKSKISATKIRSALAAAHYPEDMLAHAVLDYIKQHDLYRR